MRASQPVVLSLFRPLDNPPSSEQMVVVSDHATVLCIPDLVPSASYAASVQSSCQPILCTVDATCIIALLQNMAFKSSSASMWC